MMTWMETFTLRWELGEPLENDIAEVWVRAVIDLLKERLPNAMMYLVGFLVVKELTICYFTFSDYPSASEVAEIVAVLDKNREKILRTVRDGLGRYSQN